MFHPLHLIIFEIVEATAAVMHTTYDIPYGTVSGAIFGLRRLLWSSRQTEIRIIVICTRVPAKGSSAGDRAYDPRQEVIFLFMCPVHLRVHVTT